ncbi:hypothetical protein M422DRAFT_255072 [Sphaerobolus stellatus SS14]|uniref:Core-binding (CB) domain-containing protein n=1 Tax=Sphaerobolus stellatus (strain SS14) TaxID=990650 RepID=A0A0C9VJH4_SPHS4|nr:hypothetical protein M422DRAFT_255072 [Sphaerobolus stellatus SS14]
MFVLQQIFMLRACLDFTFHSSWLSSSMNVLADFASRFLYSRLFELAPYLNRQPTSTNPLLNASTRKTYSTGQNSYVNFILLNPQYANPDGYFLPANRFGILEWAAELGRQGKAPKTVKQYISHVKSLHVDSDLPFDACESVILQRLIRGIKRYHGEKDRNAKLPITINIL